MEPHHILQRSFKRFSLLAAPRTVLPTLWSYATLPALPPSEKIALCTMNILPPMMTVWHHLARKNVGDVADIVIFDCSGKLDAKQFPDARVLKFLNLYAATKCDYFLYTIARKRRIAWLCDDDVFIVSKNALAKVREAFADPQTASFSFRERGWWHYDIDGKTYPASGSYCLALNREIFCKREHLSLAPADGNTHPSRIGKGARRYDTFDKANEILLRKGYQCPVLPKKEENQFITGFTGMSGGVMLLNEFRTPEQTMAYFRDPPAERWSGNVLPGTLAAMLAICTIQELATTIRGRPYPLPSLPPRADLERIRRDRTPFFRKGMSLDWVDETSGRLRKEIG